MEKALCHLSSYACAIPGILATRTINDKKIRIITIMIAPLMSCSARLPIYILMIGIFVEPIYGPAISGITLFFMHFIGVLVAAPAAYLMNHCIRKLVFPRLLSWNYLVIESQDQKIFIAEFMKVVMLFISSAGTMILLSPLLYGHSFIFHVLLR